MPFYHPIFVVELKAEVLILQVFSLIFPISAFSIFMPSVRDNFPKLCPTLVTSNTLHSAVRTHLFLSQRSCHWQYCQVILPLFSFALNLSVFLYLEFSYVSTFFCRLYQYHSFYSSRDQRNSDHCWKWNQKHDFKPWTRHFAFQLVIITFDINLFVFLSSSMDEL